MSAAERNADVLAVLATATEPLGPSEIARRINKPWCNYGGTGQPCSAAVTPVLRRVGAVKSETQFGKWSKPA